MSGNGIGFNYIPGVGVVAPLFAFEVNSGGLYQPINRFVVIGHPDSTATATVATPYSIASLQQADALFGPNSMVREMVRTALRNSPGLPVWAMSVAATGTAQTWTGTVGSFTGTGIAAIEVEGEVIQVPVGTADTPTTVAAALASAVANYWNPLTGKKLSVTASPAAGVITFTARWAGVASATVDFYLPIRMTGNILNQASTWTFASGTSGAGSPNLATCLANLGDSAADFIVCPWSDSTNISNFANATNDISGRWAWSRQSYGHVWTIADASISAQTTLGLSLNDRHLTVLGVQNLPTPDWTTIAAYAASVAEWLLDIETGGVSRSHSGVPVLDVRPPRLTSNHPGWAQRNTMLQSGVSTWKVVNGAFVVDKIITTQQLGPQGQPDVTFRDVQKVYQASGGIAFIRAALANEQANKGIADANPGSLLAITTTKDIAATIAHAYKNLNKQGVFDDPDIAIGNLVCARDANNPDRVNVYLPTIPIAPLDVIAANATFYASAAQLPSS